MDHTPPSTRLTAGGSSPGWRASASCFWSESQILDKMVMLRGEGVRRPETSRGLVVGMSGTGGVDSLPVVPEERCLSGNQRLLLLWLNQPARRNPLDLETISLLREGLASAIARPEVRAVAISGRGRAFSGGGDVAGYVDAMRDRSSFARIVEEFHTLAGELARAPVPVLALVNGIAVAGGLELLLACDVVVAAEGARIGDAHQRVGMIGGGGVLARLPAVIGPARAADLVFTGRTISAAEAYEWGLVSRVVPDDELLRVGEEIAARIAQSSSLTLARSKRVLRWVVSSGAGLDAAMALESELTIEHATTSADAREGVHAFLAKRAPRFEGR